ncbi:T9SS type A sorting domain-containing protein, partial [Psychroserpens damuponensis]|uniref:T9SS type A sorting domain-containing protein n=1 Tax=Psychroserpens damuponensis TaxID=943936 RepID=UPI00058FD109
TGNWYTFIGSGSDMSILSTCDMTNYDSRIVVFTDSGATFVAQNDDGTGCSGFSSELNFYAESGVEYQVFITGFSEISVGAYELSLNCVSSFRESEVPIEDVKIDFTAYPVPFDNEVNIAYSFEFDTDVTIELYDTKGLQVFSTTNKNYVAGSKDVSTFDLSRYSSQMFYVTLTTSQGKVTKKIVSSGK